MTFADKVLQGFVFRTPLDGKWRSKRKLTTQLSLQPVFRDVDVPVRYYGNLKATELVCVQLYRVDDLIGESYCDGSGWIEPGVFSNAAVGGWRGAEGIKTYLKESTCIIRDSTNDRWNGKLVWKKKVENPEVLSSSPGSGFSTYISNKLQHEGV